MSEPWTHEVRCPNCVTVLVIKVVRVELLDSTGVWVHHGPEWTSLELQGANQTWEAMRRVLESCIQTVTMAAACNPEYVWWHGTEAPEVPGWRVRLGGSFLAAPRGPITAT